MERMIGEIFEYNGEWYQCVEGITCLGCVFQEIDCNKTKSVIGGCEKSKREDRKGVIFKKLEKVGEPITVKGRTFQKLTYDNASCKECVFNIPNKACYKNDYIDGPCLDMVFWAKIKQNKEDMEEYKMYDAKEDIPEFDKVVDECLFGKDKLNLKPFDIQKAREGKPVCTRDGRKARIICFDRKDNTPIVALIECINHAEILQCVHNDGKCFHYDTSDNDLMMLPAKKEGWVNIYKGGLLDTKSYSSKEEAVGKASQADYIDTIKISWEE